MKICALIPAFNEAPHIDRVVEGAREHLDSVVVIDGCFSGISPKFRPFSAACLADRGESPVLKGHDFSRAVSGSK